MKIGLTMPVINNFRGAVEVIESARTGHDLVIDIQPQWREQLPLAAAWNRGAQKLFREGCDYAIVANDDVLFAPECIDKMVGEMERLRSEKVILVSANNILGLLADPLAILSYGETADVSISDHPNYSLFMIGREFFDLVGTFDENFTPAWFEDNDSHRRITLLGYRAVCSTACPSIHYGSVSTNLLPARDSSASAMHYHKKWGGMPGAESYATPYNDGRSPREWMAK